MGLGYVGAMGVKGGQEGVDHWIKSRLEQQLADERLKQQAFENQMREKEFASSEQARTTQQELLAETRKQAANDRLFTIGHTLGDQIPGGVRMADNAPQAPALGAAGLLRTTGDFSRGGPTPPAALAANNDVDPALREEPGTLGNSPARPGTGARLMTKLPSAVQQQREADDVRADAQLRRQEAVDAANRERDRQTELYRDKQLAATQNNRNNLSASGEDTVIERLTKQWTVASKPARDIDRQLALMDEGMKAVERGDMAQGAQAVLVTFQKILDPPSVVRESEYMRSAAGQSLLNRVKGAVQQLEIGGAGVSAEELAKFARLAREAAAAQKSGYVQQVRARLGRTAAHFRIPEDLIFEDAGDVEDPTPETPPVVGATGTPAPIRPAPSHSGGGQTFIYDMDGNPVKTPVVK